MDDNHGKNENMICFSKKFLMVVLIILGLGVGLYVLQSQKFTINSKAAETFPFKKTFTSNGKTITYYVSDKVFSAGDDCPVPPPEKVYVYSGGVDVESTAKACKRLMVYNSRAYKTDDKGKELSWYYQCQYETVNMQYCRDQKAIPTYGIKGGLGLSDRPSKLSDVDICPPYNSKTTGYDYKWSGGICYKMKSRPVFSTSGLLSYCANQGLPGGTKDVWENCCMPDSMKPVNKDNSLVRQACMKAKAAVAANILSACSDKTYGLRKLFIKDNKCYMTQGILSGDGQTCKDLELEVINGELVANKCKGSVYFNSDDIFYNELNEPEPWLKPVL